MESKAWASLEPALDQQAAAGALAHWLSMIFSENRCTLFRIML
jgi:hypothetical protein